MVTAISIEGEAGKLTGIGHDFVRIRFDGELDESNVETAAEKVYRLIDESLAEAVFFFDFEKLAYMNSKSLGYLSDWYTKITERGGQIIIIAPQPTIEDVLRTVGLDAFIPIAKQYDNAPQYIKKEGN